VVDIGLLQDQHGPLFAIRYGSCACVLWEIAELYPPSVAGTERGSYFLSLLTKQADTQANPAQVESSAPGVGGTEVGAIPAY